MAASIEWQASKPDTITVKGNPPLSAVKVVQDIVKSVKDK